MFGKKKNTVEFDGIPVVLSLRNTFNTLTGRIGYRFLGYKVGDEWKGLVGFEQYREEVSLINKKLDLILSHLNPTYQPETEKKEPARLVRKPDLMLGGIPIFLDNEDRTINTKPKKKRGRPKKK